LQRHPDHADAIHLLGVVTAKQGRIEPAIDLVRRAIVLKPDWPVAHYHLGNLLQMRELLDLAIESYQRAIALKPDYLQACNNLGIALKEMDRIDEAIAVLERVVVLSPGDAMGFVNLGNALLDKREFGRSLAAHQKAIALKPDLAEAHLNLAAVLKEMGKLEESIAAIGRAIELRPHFAEAHNNLGTALEESGLLDESLAAYSRAIAINPHYERAHFNLGNNLKAMGRMDESIAAYRRSIAISPAFVEAHSNLVYAMHFHPDHDAAAIAAESRRWSQQHAEPLKKFIQPHTNDRSPTRRLRIGYVSPDFKEHPVGRFLLPLWDRRDKSQFELFAYAQVPVADAVTEKLRSCADQWRNITGMPDAEVADLIRNDRIDILVDLTMHMAGNRLLVFARKPAPVQVSWLAYCSTTELDAMDYRLSDSFLDPPGMDESVYREKTIRLPETYWCHRPVDGTSDVNSLPSLRAGHVTFGCLNNFAKVSEPALTTWTNLLLAVPNSVLLLHAPPGSHRKQLQERFGQEAIAPDRIRFVGKQPLRAYLRLHHQIDIALDTFPYGGGTTTCDALWMGVPVISLKGNTAVGRGGVSILNNIGLEEWVADSPAKYVETAVALANDVSRLADLRATLRRRMEHSPLMDAPRFAGEIEAAYRRMWRTWCEAQT
jgi:predicted O-linked N-acetylglucosamine transferase (SPINDLY family)